MIFNNRIWKTSSIFRIFCSISFLVRPVLFNCVCPRYLYLSHIFIIPFPLDSRLNVSFLIFCFYFIITLIHHLFWKISVYNKLKVFFILVNNHLIVSKKKFKNVLLSSLVKERKFLSTSEPSNKCSCIYYNNTSPLNF